MTSDENNDTSTTDVVDTAPQDTAAEAVDQTTDATTQASDASDPAPATETKTLLSDDEGEGAGGEGVEVPEAYTFEPPEGFEISEEVQSQLDGFSDTAKEMGLSQAQYQKLVEYDIQRGRQAVEASAAQYTQRIEAWAGDVRADQELGGEGLNANLAVARTAIERFGSPELARLIAAPTPDNPDGLGIGNHPELIRLMYRVGRAMSEDTFVEGGNAGAAPADSNAALQRMYPTMFEQAS